MDQWLFKNAAFSRLYKGYQGGTIQLTSSFSLSCLFLSSRVAPFLFPVPSLPKRHRPIFSNAVKCRNTKSKTNVYVCDQYHPIGWGLVENEAAYQSSGVNPSTGAHLREWHPNIRGNEITCLIAWRYGFKVKRAEHCWPVAMKTTCIRPFDKFRSI